MSAISLPPSQDEPPLVVRVASEVRALRGRYSITQARLAEVLGTTQSQVSKRLRGEIPFTLDDLDRLAVFFNVKPTQLLDGAPGNGQGPDGGGVPTVPYDVPVILDFRDRTSQMVTAA